MSQLYAIAVAVSWSLGNIPEQLLAAFATFAKAAAPMAVSALWQGTLMAAGTTFFIRITPRISAAQRFTAWAVGFAVVLILPFLPLFSHVASSIAPTSLATSAANVMPRPWLELDSRWATVIAVLWLAVALFRLAELVFHSIRLRKLWKSGTPIEDCAPVESLHPRRRIEICTTRALDRPSVIGFFAPRILIPEWLFERLTADEFEQVVMHEAEHIRRRDDWTNLLQKICLILFPLNLALAWMERRMCREREMACDEGVVQRTHAPRAYAACLTSLAERGLQRDVERRAEALSLAAWRRRPELVHRVHSILRRKQALHPLAARALLTVGGCGLLLGSVELARCPQMVEFVAAPKPVAIAQLEPGLTSARESQLTGSGFRAIETRAILPSGAAAPATTGDAPVYRGARRPSSAAKNESNDGAPREQLIKATIPADSPAIADQDSNQSSGSEYIVLTTWEEVAPHRSRKIADYDTGEAAQEETRQDGGHVNVNADLPAQITVTRLIFRIYATGQTPDSTANSKTANAHDSKTNQPVLLPLDCGWLAFQL